MGASGWSYFVSYQQDIAQALQQLREQVFASGDFYNHKAREVTWLRAMDNDTYQKEYQEMVESWLAACLVSCAYETREERIARLEQEQTTIAGLLLHDDGSGTHSILDIYSICDKIPDKREYNIAVPLPHEDVIAIFGTAHPTHEMLESRWEDVMQAAPSRWIGAYVIVWRLR
jgi:hypothetical protein